MIREIVLIDEEKCDGCGLCVPNCEEGAIRIIGGKARLVSDRLCDGLGACLGHCPQGAIRIEQREAEDFDEQAVEAHLRAMQSQSPGPLGLPTSPPSRPVSRPGLSAEKPAIEPGPAASHAHGGGCPSQRFARLGGHGQSGGSCSAGASVREADGRSEPAGAEQISELGQWPVQLRLLPPRAPMFENADLLLAADCVPFALPDFHSRLLRGRAVAIACPKLDDTSSYLAKLTEIIAANNIRRITVAHMEVPCCTGILMMALQARSASGVDVPIEDVVIGVRGEILRRSLVD